MGDIWEYLFIQQKSDWSKKDHVTLAVQRPGEDGGLAPLAGTDVVNELQKLGAQGWELVGPPTVYTGIVGIPGRNQLGQPFSADAADWHRREFWLKRKRDQ